MKLDIKNNTLIKIEEKKLEKKLEGKEYLHNLSGKTFSFTDFQLPVLHKKKIKIIHWKDLGDKMQVFFVNWKNEGETTKRDTKWIPDLKQYKKEFETALDLFRGFDEEQGEEYSFLYKVSQKKIEEMTPLLSYFELTLEQKNTIWTKKIGEDTNTKQDTKQRKNKFEILAFFFGLLHIYGNTQKKKENILWIKIAIPLFGIYTQKEKLFLNLWKILADEFGIFVAFHIQENNEGKILELSSNDSELLTIFSQWKNSVEKQDEIISINKVLEEEKAKILLKEYLQESWEEHQEEYNTENKREELSIKLLTKM